MRLPVIALAAGLALQAHAQQPVVAEAPLRAHLSCWPTICSKDAAPASAAAISRALSGNAGRRPRPQTAGRRHYRQLVKAEGTKLLPGSFARFTADNGKILTPAIGPEILIGTMSGKASPSTRRWCSSATAPWRRKKNGTTTRAWT
jgi:hypothetical protein